jgi:hypothetical protein
MTSLTFTPSEDEPGYFVAETSLGDGGYSDTGEWFFFSTEHEGIADASGIAPSKEEAARILTLFLTRERQG